MDVTFANRDFEQSPEVSSSRRFEGKLYGERFCGDPRTGLVHDLDGELEDCRLDGSFEAGCEQGFHTLADAHMDGYDSCPHCIQTSRTS